MRVRKPSAPIHSKKVTEERWPDLFAECKKAIWKNMQGCDIVTYRLKDGVGFMQANKGSSEYRLLSGLFFKLLPYHVLLLAISAINGIVDSVYASNVIGKSAMTAIGLFSPFNHFLYAASMLFVSGTQMLYGRYLAKDRQNINGLLSVNLVVSGGLAVLSALLMVVAAMTGATRVFISKDPDLQMLNDYIFGQAIGIPALVLGQQLFSFLSLENQRKLTMVASIACLAVNTLFDHLFIVVFRMGTFGLGLSTSISFLVFLGIQASFYIRGKSEWKLSLRGCRWVDAGKIVTLGYPGALSRFVEMFRCLIVNALVLAYIGSDGMSSFAASNSVLAVIWAVPFGMVAVSRMLFSISIGEEDRRSLVTVFRIVLTRGMAMMALIVAALIFLAEPLTQMFYQDPSDPVYRMTVMGFRMLPLCMPLAVISLDFAAYAQTAEKKVLSTVLPVVDGMVGVTLCSLILIPSMKRMSALYLANILNGVICLAVIVISAWIHRKEFPNTFEECLDIPDDIGVGEEDRIDISVTKIEEVMAVSRQITAFCKEHGVDSRRGYFAGLCMEEMAGNVVEHGFKSDDKAHSADIRVVLKGNEIILRIRDNCKGFDPAILYAKATDEEDAGKNVGIKLVYRIAKDVSYQNLLGMNVLTMRI